MKNNYLLEQVDEYLIELKINEIIESREFSSSPVHSYDMEEVPLSSAIEDLDTYGLFSEKKVIIVSHIESLASDTSEKEIEHFLKYLKNPLDSILLFVTARKLNNTKKITKELKKNLECPSFSVDAVSFIKKELQGYQVDSQVVRRLATECLEDIGRIHQECSKLKLYCLDSKKITLEDVDSLVIRKLGDSKDLTFEFVRVLAEKDKKKALGKYHELCNYSIEPLSLLGLLASQYLIMYQVKVLEEKMRLNQEIADTLGEKPYRIQKTRELTRYYSKEELRAIFRKLADIDLKIKTTDVDGSFLIELFILENA